MKDLDALAGSATRELLDRSNPDVASRYAELPRIRTRRTTAKVVALAAVVVLGVGGWQLRPSGSTTIEPAPPVGHGNGALLGEHDVASAASSGWGTAYGPAPASLPPDVATDVPLLQWSADGSLLYYTNQDGQLASWDVAAGHETSLVPCPGATGCVGGAISPDGSVAIFPGDGHAVLVGLADGTTRTLAGRAFEAGSIAWSPDARQFATVTPYGLWTVDADGTHARLVHEFQSTIQSAFGGVSWSPDGTRIAFLDVAPDPEHGSTSYTLTTVRADGSDARTVHEAGWCECERLGAPSLDWSPDGALIAVALSGTDETQGIYTVHPDGSGWTLRKPGTWTFLTWQPVG